MNATEGLEETLQQVLNDPNSMAQILSLARSLGLQQEAAPEPSAPPPVPTDEGAMLAMLQMFQQLQHTDSKQDALLCALKPYLAPERRQTLDRAMQLARLSHIAGMALKNSGGLLGGKGG